MTSTVVSDLKAGSSFVFAKLFRFQCMNFWHYNPDGDYEDFTYTDAAFPIFINKYQTAASGVAQLGTWSSGHLNADGLMFQPDTMECGTLEYGIGFEDRPIDVTWPMDDTRDYLGSSGISLTSAISPANLTLKQAFTMGAFTECPFWIHLAIFDDFPSRGGSLLGTTLMFRGYVRTVTATRTLLKIGLASLMDVFQNVQLPTQTITPNNREIPYVPAAPGSAGGAFVDSLIVNSPTSITFHSNFGTFSVARDAQKDEWFAFQPFIGSYPIGLLPGPGLPPPPMWRISGNEASSGSDFTFYFYEPPVVPSGNVIGNRFGQSDLGSGTHGFPFVPPPEVSTP